MVAMVCVSVNVCVCVCTCYLVWFYTQCKYYTLKNYDGIKTVEFLKHKKKKDGCEEKWLPEPPDISQVSRNVNVVLKLVCRVKGESWCGGRGNQLSIYIRGFPNKKLLMKDNEGYKYQGVGLRHAFK